MNADFTNYAQLPADKVLAACIKYLDAREARIQREREEVIAKYMKPRCFGLLKRTREQAIAYAKDDNIVWSSWAMISMVGKGTANEINDLGILARLAIKQQVNEKTPMVLVNADIAAYLENFIEQ